MGVEFGRLLAFELREVESQMYYGENYRIIKQMVNAIDTAFELIRKSPKPRQ